ncbi:Gmad2 immunoglobulin-like domain-containing protein [Paenibacillus sp. OV219]|uniref:Gmad2 immunoglobulin-like domain-containing protein n=1 Tax=Paenibacillus sp. OV219 TaxID=1884377 RepID=UPI0008ADF4DF|nr:Gmad2 immunoglobulin-like domain-containing protein [Paenibacillus sp. OV219]SEN57424.1 Immunoglobulin-like domain of spore germination [Paenibacillus sp. OV219]
MRKRLPIIISLIMLLLAAAGCAGNNHNAVNEPGKKPYPAPEPAKPAIVASNDAFRVYGPAEGSEVGKSFTVKGQARVFEAAFRFSFEDGHNVLAEGQVIADIGAPEWGNFEFIVTLDEAPTSPVGTLTIYELSAKDGSAVHALHLSYNFEKELLNTAALDVPDEPTIVSSNDTPSGD